MAVAEATFFAKDMKFISQETYDAFFAVVDRLEMTLDRETEALKGQRLRELPEFTKQKHQSFLELHRIMRSLEGTVPSQDILDRLAAFRGKVESNGELLGRQMRATQEIADTIARVIQDIESDGTYSHVFNADRTHV